MMKKMTTVVMALVDHSCHGSHDAAVEQDLLDEC